MAGTVDARDVQAPLDAIVGAEANAHAGPAGAMSSLRRALAMALLPLSILPVALFGRALLRAPEKLWREAQAEVQRLQAPRRSTRAEQPRPVAPGRSSPARKRPAP